MSVPDIDVETADLLRRFGFDAEVFETLRTRLVRGEAGAAQNRLRTLVTPPQPADLYKLPLAGTVEREALARRGDEAIRAGAVGCVVLAGGMATRFGGVVKAGVEALPARSFLELKLRDVAVAAARAGGRVPVHLMTSFATDDAVTEMARAASTDRVPVTTFAQGISLRLDSAGGIFRDVAGRASPYAPGHGDLVWALRRSGALARFREAGGTTLAMSNVDNLAATLDPAVIGAHLDGGAEITVEVTAKEPGEKGGAPARVDGRVQIVESFRFPEGFDEDSIPVFNTNTLVLDAAAIDRDFALTWFAVRKKVDGREAVQFERLVGELTAFLRSGYLEVSRYGAESRFTPAKDPEELAKRRPDIEAALAARGVLDA